MGKRINVPQSQAEWQFYRQVIFDHFSHHNHHYPDFEIDDYHYEIVQLRVDGAKDRIRYFDNETLEDMWSAHFESFLEDDNAGKLKYDYIIFREMIKNKTPPFPPVILDPKCLMDDDFNVYGRKAASPCRRYA